jgi:predicted N-acetyltransferase YhbS
MLVRLESPADHEAVRQVNLLAFANGAEARLVDQLRSH